MRTVGLPWRWAMKDIHAPDPWSRITCHSFTSTMMSCNDSRDILYIQCIVVMSADEISIRLWDWSTSRKTGTVHLDLPSSAHIKFARFVNELHEQTVILAEISKTYPLVRCRTDA